MQIEPLCQIGWKTDIHVRPVGRHRLHSPLPMIVSPLVLWSFEMIFGWVERQGGRAIAELLQFVLQPIMENPEGPKTFLDGGAHRRADFDALWHDIDRFQIAID